MSGVRDSVGNGYYGDSGGGEPTSKPTSTDDFADYMWMADEEEAEKEMLREIEEEQLMEKCLNDMLAEEEVTYPLHQKCADFPAGGWSGGSPCSGPPPQQQCVSGGQQTAPPVWSSGPQPAFSHHLPPPPLPQQQQQQQSAAVSSSADQLAHRVQNLSVAEPDRPQMALNPLAAEFVPGQTFQSSSG